MSKKVDEDRITAIISEADVDDIFRATGLEIDLAKDVDLSKDEDWLLNFFGPLVLVFNKKNSKQQL